jgi:2-keto-3-deoxy-L-rhamnonate aldolase RhmA
LVAVQVETVRALEAVEEIAAVPGVDMLFVGPMDLSHSLGLTGRLGHPLLRAAIRRIFAAGRRRGRWLGVLAPDRAFAAWCVRRGARFLAYAGDVRFLTGGARAALASLDSLARPGKVQARRGAR